MSFSEKSLNIIELPTILEMLAQGAVTDTAREICAGLRPSAEAGEVRRLQAETQAAVHMITVRGNPSIYRLHDIRPSLSRTRLGGTLNTRELLDVARVLQCARVLKTYVADDGVGKTCIDHMFYGLRANKYLEEKINNSITAEDEIADGASSELLSIRRKMRAASAKAKEILQKIISSPSYAKALQEPIVTMRGERYVIPVRSDHRAAVPGLVHDISSTGMTVFVEPMGVVKANNELRELAIREKAEIERILAELSADCAEHSEDIDSDYDLIVRIDLIFARANLSYRLNCMSPEISERRIDLRKARHPLLNKDTAVPVDLELGGLYDTLVITGPNTGGKTVALKTIGLLAAMNQCGLQIPAGAGSCLPVFGNILADIGDEQSIEQSLSTFSAHMTNIVRILSECGPDSLILFDELGAGTDPTEGAALAVSIIEYARKNRCLVAATTHYTELKVYATNTPGVQNASCEFDVETLSPTYRLLVGVPGKSNAFAISKRLGLSDYIIEDAKQRVGVESETFEATIEKLEQARTMLENEREEAEKLRRKAEEDARKSARLRAELELRLEKADLKTKREAERIIADARQVAEATFAELDEMRRRANEEEAIQQLNDARSELRRKLNQKTDELRVQKPAVVEEEPADTRPVAAGDTVTIRSMGTKAEVIAVNKDGSLQLRAGILNLTVKPGEVFLSEKKEAKTKKTISQKSSVKLRDVGMSDEIDLRGMDSIEAVTVAEQYIDSAVMGKLSTVRIIHGKGTGALRAAIHQMLKRNKLVRSFRLGVYGEGETGVTVVELK